jgi:hypothetical protein
MALSAAVVATLQRPLRRVDVFEILRSTVSELCV